MFLAVAFFFLIVTCTNVSVQMFRNEAGLTIIKPYFVNNWFNYYEHNGWSLNHEAWTWYTTSHLVSRKTCTNSI